MLKSPLSKMSRDNKQTQVLTGFLSEVLSLTSILFTFKIIKTSTPRRHGVEARLRMKDELVVLRGT